MLLGKKRCGKSYNMKICLLAYQFHLEEKMQSGITSNFKSVYLHMYTYKATWSWCVRRFALDTRATHSVTLPQFRQRLPSSSSSVCIMYVRTINFSQSQPNNKPIKIQFYATVNKPIYGMVLPSLRLWSSTSYNQQHHDSDLMEKSSSSSSPLVVYDIICPHTQLIELHASSQDQLTESKSSFFFISLYIYTPNRVISSSF
jgi:hypothetical protein